MLVRAAPAAVSAMWTSCHSSRLVDVQDADAGGEMYGYDSEESGT